MAGLRGTLVVFLCLIACLSCRRQSAPAAAKRDSAVPLWRKANASLDSELAAMDMRSFGASQAAFKRARLLYKRGEFLWEYSFPLLAVKLNGPNIDEVERDCEHTVVPPQGFQVLEAGLFPRPAAAPESLEAQVRRMRSVLSDSLPEEIAWSDSSLLDAARLELFRLAFLGTTNFDSPAARQGLRETHAALAGIADALEARFGGSGAGKEGLEYFLSLDQAAMDYLERRYDSADFDHGHFLIAHMNPLYTALGDFQEAVGAPLPSEDRAFAPDAKSLFAPAAWNLRFFAPPFGRNATSEQAALGRSLFHDPVLSGRGDRACASCHQPSLAFTDGLPKSVSVNGKSSVARNAPTLIHAAFQQGAFADLRAGSLEDQADAVVHNPAEMGGNLDSAAARLNRDSTYARRFLEAFAGDSLYRDRDIPVNPVRIRRALAAYVRSLVSFDSPWDRYVRGDADALEPEARRGFNVFMGKGACATCHFAPLFNGTPPPMYEITEMEVLGVPDRPVARRARAAVDPDSGRSVIDHTSQSLHAFKTPTLRNIALTAPYMHNGVFATLEEVVDFYDAGGGQGMGLDVPNQTLAPDSLHLTKGEKRDLVAFMKALSDTAGMTAVPPDATKLHADGYATAQAGPSKASPKSRHRHARGFKGRVTAAEF